MVSLLLSIDRVLTRSLVSFDPFQVSPVTAKALWKNNPWKYISEDKVTFINRKTHRGDLHWCNFTSKVYLSAYRIDDIFQWCRKGQFETMSTHSLATRISCSKLGDGGRDGWKITGAFGMLIVQNFQKVKLFLSQTSKEAGWPRPFGTFVWENDWV